MMDHTSQTVDDWVKGRIVLPSHLKNTENKVIVVVVINNIIITIVATEVVQFWKVDLHLLIMQTLTMARVAGL